MKFFPQKIKGVFLIKPSPFKDKRGIFRRHYCFRSIKKIGLKSKILQSNLSFNKLKYTLRGFHYQLSPKSEDKILSCLNGSIYDIVVDLRKKSKTYMQWVSFRLDDKNMFSIVIPRGCANAFMTLKDKTLIHYYCTNNYDIQYERGVRFNDPNFKFKWPHSPINISIKDKNWADY
jgi:dTDP-4-dehydrorhamnose 3,5-epimerase